MNQRSRQHFVLNFDNSAGIPEHAQVIELGSWQEQIRFGCRWAQFKRLQAEIAGQLPSPEQTGCVLIGSGDYHHITQLLLARFDEKQPIHLIVCDNHPDNMRYPFGIHCGSWVYWASRLPQVARIDVIGIGSEDVSPKHAWENHWSPLYKSKLHYWSIQQNVSWTKWIGAKQAWHGFQDANSLIQAFLPTLDQINLPVYLSIDKDVLSKEVVMTNWDQGYFLAKHLIDLIEHCQGKLIGADITGDVSAYQYQSRFKRFLSESDGQSEPSQDEISSWQIHQQDLNQKLLRHIDQTWRENTKG